MWSFEKQLITFLSIFLAVLILIILTIIVLVPPEMENNIMTDEQYATLVKGALLNRGPYEFVEQCAEVCRDLADKSSAPASWRGFQHAFANLADRIGPHGN